MGKEITDSGRHAVVGAQDGPGQLFPFLHEGLDNLDGDGLEIIAVGKIFLIGGEAELRHDLLPAAEAEDGILLFLQAGDIEAVPDLMVPEDMADELLIGFGVVVHNAGAEGMAPSQVENGKPLVPGAPDDAVQLLGVIDIPVQEDQGGKLVIADHVIDAAGDIAAVAGPVPVHG